MITKYEQYVAEMQKIADVNYSIGLLQWDKEVKMPTKGAAIRSQQISTLSGIVHELSTSDALGDLLETLFENKDSLSEKQAKNVVLSREKFLKKKKYTIEFVKHRSRVVANAYHQWIAARKANDYGVFKEALREIVKISREETKILGYEGHPYNALVDQYEKGMKVNVLDELFKDVRQQLVDFGTKVRECEQVDNSFLHKFYEKDKQWKFGLELLKEIGYDFEAGRQDISTHPFSINFNSNDVRVTTRIDENDFANMTWSTIHEGGHALYEQGLPLESYGLPLGTNISLGIHESQSRLWENNVGRSLSFWKPRYENVQNIFPEALKGVDLDAFYKGMNRVEANLIRTESDELNYHFHVLIRYEIEKGLIEGSLEVDDLDKVWNQKYKEYMGVDVPDDNQGILQDIHWSHGSLGYFPTYSLGSFYAAQFYQQAEKEIENLKESIESGDTQPLLDWLRDKVHRHGRFYTAEELCIKITGEPLNFKYFMNYAKAKYGDIYGL
ncbi:MAG: carboxypeptidase M32 [Saprospiraceae bacterium]